MGTLLTVIAAVSLVAALVAVLVAWLLTRDTSHIVEAVAQATRSLATGKLPEPIAIDRRGAAGRLAWSFNDLALAVAGRIRSIETEREHLAAVLSHMADGVLIADRDGIIQITNPAAARLLELSPSWAHGHPALALARYPELVGLVRETLTDAPVGTIAPRLLELGPPGRRRAIQAVASRLPADDKRPRALVMLQDVTALRRAEAARRELVANVSHELRTPVAALKALVETLEAGALEEEEVAREFLGRMAIEVDGLAQLIEELLELARVESGQVAVRLQPTDLGAVVTAAAERLRPQAERQGLTLLVETAPDLPLVQADPERVQQVVVNLVHNAVKFTPPGGSVTVSVAAAPTRTADADGAMEGDRPEVVVRVADSGIGIAPEVLPRLFERFFKADRARSGGGTGLGLAIAKHLIEAHGGRIWAESAGEGQGSTFCFALPAVMAAADDIPSSTAPRA